MILQDSLVHKTCAANPCVFWQCIGHHWNVSQVGHGFDVLFNPVVHVQIGRSATAPVKRGRPCDAFVLHVLNQGFDGRKAGARSQQNHGCLRVFAQVETAVGAFNAQDVFFLHGAEHHVGELAARHVANVQLYFGCSGV